MILNNLYIYVMKNNKGRRKNGTEKASEEIMAEIFHFMKDKT